jgi:hypothetical protein
MKKKKYKNIKTLNLIIAILNLLSSLKNYQYIQLKFHIKNYFLLKKKKQLYNNKYIYIYK